MPLDLLNGIGWVCAAQPYTTGIPSRKRRPLTLVSGGTQTHDRSHQMRREMNAYTNRPPWLVHKPNRNKLLAVWTAPLDYNTLPESLSQIFCSLHHFTKTDKIEGSSISMWIMVNRYEDWIKKVKSCNNVPLKSDRNLVGWGYVKNIIFILGKGF